MVTFIIRIWYIGTLSLHKHIKRIHSYILQTPNCIHFISFMSRYVPQLFSNNKTFMFQMLHFFRSIGFLIFWSTTGEMSHHCELSYDDKYNPQVYQTWLLFLLRWMQDEASHFFHLEVKFCSLPVSPLGIVPTVTKQRKG